MTIVNAKAVMNPIPTVISSTFGTVFFGFGHSSATCKAPSRPQYMKHGTKRPYMKAKPSSHPVKFMKFIQTKSWLCFETERPSVVKMETANKMIVKQKPMVCVQEVLFSRKILFSVTTIFAA